MASFNLHCELPVLFYFLIKLRKIWALQGDRFSQSNMPVVLMFRTDRCCDPITCFSLRQMMFYFFLITEAVPGEAFQIQKTDFVFYFWSQLSISSLSLSFVLCESRVAASALYLVTCASERIAQHGNLWWKTEITKDTWFSWRDH